MRQPGELERLMPALRPGSWRKRQSVADDHVVVGMQAVGDFIKDARVFVVGDQAIGDFAVFIADVVPNAVAAIIHECAMFEGSTAGEDDFVAAGFPIAIEALGVVVSHGATGHSQAVSALGAKAELAVVLKNAVSHRDVLSPECGPAGVRVLEDAILQNEVVADCVDGSALARLAA